MKNLKFRAWDIVSEQMSPEFGIFGEFLLNGLLFSWQYKYRPDLEFSLDGLNDLIVMQYIGFNDINGNPIYEGDIVKAFFDKDKLENFLYLQMTNKELEQGYRIMVIDDINMSLPDDIEIIGNKFKNPELI